MVYGEHPQITSQLTLSLSTLPSSFLPSLPPSFPLFSSPTHSPSVHPSPLSPVSALLSPLYVGGWGGGWRRRKLWMIEKEKKELRLKPEQFRRRCWCILKWQNKFLTDFQNLVQVLHERMFSLSAELSIEVIQVEGPDEGTAKLLFLQILDLRRGQRRNQFDFLSTNKQKYTWPLRIQNNYLDVKAYALGLTHLEEDAVVHHGQVGVKQPTAYHSVATGHRCLRKEIRGQVRSKHILYIHTNTCKDTWIFSLSFCPYLNVLVCALQKVKS